MSDAQQPSNQPPPMPAGGPPQPPAPVAHPQHPAAYPQQPAAYPPQQPGAYPQQPPAYAPQQPVAYPPQQPGAYPQQPPAYAPQQPVAYPPQQPAPAPYAAPYVAPRPPAGGIPAPSAPPLSPAPGFIALALALLATLGATIVGAVAAWQIGLGAGKAIASRPVDADFDWSILSPVRDHVLTGEISLWVGTAVGIAALIVGIIAIIKNRGRIPGMIAVVIAALGPIAYFAAVATALSAALPVGTGIGG